MSQQIQSLSIGHEFELEGVWWMWITVLRLTWAHLGRRPTEAWFWKEQSQAEHATATVQRPLPWGARSKHPFNRAAH
jgi:hypothetical protein